MSGWRSLVPAFLGWPTFAQVYKKSGSTSASSSRGPESKYMYCYRQRFTKRPTYGYTYTCYTTVADAANRTGDFKEFDELPSNALEMD